LASQRPIIAIGPTDGDAAKILNNCSAGKIFKRDDKSGLTLYLQSLAQNSINFTPDKFQIQNFSRTKQAEQLIVFLNH
jgi:hypothetical protein